MVSLGQGVFNGLLCISLTWQVGGDSPVDIANMVGSLFITCTNIFMGTFFRTLTVFQLERPVFLREQANNMYGLFPYFMTKNLID